MVAQENKCAHCGLDNFSCISVGCIQGWTDLKQLMNIPEDLKLEAKPLKCESCSEPCGNDWCCMKGEK